MPPLITLRGPSASGKTSTAYALRQRMLDNGIPQVVLIEQDYFRRKVWKEKDWHSAHKASILAVIELAWENSIPVILEGIFTAKHYTEMFSAILARHPEENYSFYFDIPFEETLRRHQSKPNAHEFGEKEMRRWYSPQDTIEILNETVIGAEVSQEEIVEKIYGMIDNN